MQNLYEQMVNDPAIIEAYALIAKKEKLSGPDNYASHDINHINRVICYCAKIATLLGLDSDNIAGIKIAALLHDIGCESRSKAEHAKRSYEWAKNYLTTKKINTAKQEAILTAIKEHSEGANSIYGKILTFADKIDICDKRILPQGRLLAGNRQYAHIIFCDFNIKAEKLTVQFQTDGKIDLDEMNEYYFTKKVYRSIKDLAAIFGLNHEILIDGMSQ